MNNVGILGHGTPACTEVLAAAVAAGLPPSPIEVMVNLTDEDWRHMTAIRWGDVLLLPGGPAAHGGERRGAIINMAGIDGLGRHGWPPTPDAPRKT